MKLRFAFLLSAVLVCGFGVLAKEWPGDKMLADYFRTETEKLANACLTDIKSLQDWESRKPKYREQLFEMLGLSPLPAKTDLQATITGKIDHEEFTVEKLHFQSLPGLYVTANLYLPKNVTGPAPTILYMSGHAKVFTNGVSLGNKAAYQHHGIWFARHGYACLVVDTLQLGEIEGIHHGTHNKGMWWWNSRGYTPAGVEAWNYIRALDYLETRPEVDKTKFGATGRSGGGAYSWVIGALDDRIKASAPVAGITDLENYVVDHKVERHCDCMFHVNTYRWDYPLVAALTAPRPLLFCNTDKDEIFPLEGVVRTHAKIWEIYKLYGATTNLGLLITEGPHKDTQDLQVPTFRWFNRFLKGEDPKIAVPAEKLFEPMELRVFNQLPSDAINDRIHETFVPMASTSAANKENVKKQLREKVFAGWPAGTSSPVPRRIAMAGKEGLQFAIYEFETQPHVTLRAYVLKSQDHEAKQVQMRVLDEESWAQWLPAAMGGFPELLKPEGAAIKAKENPEAFAALRNDLLEKGEAYVFLAPRGVGLTAWTTDPKKQTHIRRRYMLLGQTLDGMRVWDIIRAMEIAPALAQSEARLTVDAQKAMAVNALYASLFSPKPRSLTLQKLPPTHNLLDDSADYLGVLRFTDISAVMGMVQESGVSVSVHEP